MYPVSEAYREVIVGTHRNYKIEGAITLKNGTEIPLSDKNVSEGSLSIDNQCVNGEAFELGSVYSGQLTITIQSDIDRYSLYDGTIRLSFFLEVTKGVFEEVPLGIYNINEAIRKGNNVSLKALDNMIFLDMDFSDRASSGKAWDILGLISDETGIEIGMTQEYVESLPNGTSHLRVPATFSLDTMRDLVSALAAVQGCFAAMDREGKLTFVRFAKEPVLTIEPGFRTSSEFSDFTVQYTAVETAVNGSLQVAALEEDTGMTLTLEENPFFQVEDETILQYLMNSVLTEVSSIQYVPSTLSTYGDPSIDLGDLLLCKLRDGTEIQSLVTSAGFKYRAEQPIKSVGKNPRLAGAKTKEQKKLGQVSNQVSSKDIIFYSFINARELSITTKDQAVSIDFVTQEGRLAEFRASILLSAIADTEGSTTTVKATYFKNDVELTTYYPTETYSDGPHILVLYYPFSGLEKNKVHKVEVFLEVSGGTVTVDKGNAIATISGQGLAAKLTEWDGNLDFEESIAPFKYDYCFTGFTDEIDVAERIPHQPIFTESIRPLKYEYFFSGFTGETVANEVVTSNTITQFTSSSKYIIIDEESARLRTAYERESIAGIIDNGYLEWLELTSEWRRIDSVDIKTNIDREVN